MDFKKLAVKVSNYPCIFFVQRSHVVRTKKMHPEKRRIPAFFSFFRPFSRFFKNPFFECKKKMHDLTEREAFVKGFTLGVKIIIEVMTNTSEEE